MEETKNKFQCQTCRSSFSSKGNLKKHEAQAHQYVEGQSTDCPVCKVLFTRSSAMVHHLRTLHGTTPLDVQGEYRYKCGQCQTPFTTKTHCKEHEATAHRQVEGSSIQCTGCNVIFTNDKAHANHRKHVHREEEYKITRFIVRNESNSQGNEAASSIRNEMHFSCSVRKNFSCNICGKTYVRKKDCYEHIKKKHAIEVQEPHNGSENVGAPNSEPVSNCNIQEGPLYASQSEGIVESAPVADTLCTIEGISDPMDLLDDIISPNTTGNIFPEFANNISNEQYELFQSIFQEPSSS